MSDNMINLRESLRLELIRVSNVMGFKISTKNDLDKTLLDYLTVRFKLIEIKPRIVKFQKDLFADVFTGKHIKSDEIKRIANIARVGNNLNHFQSKKILQANFHDHLINEWKVHHLHLSFKEDKKSSFVKQGNTILFVYVNDTEIIFLGTDKHREGVFGDEKWLKILHNEFPEVIEKYKANSDIISIYPKVNAKERQDIWNKGFSMGMTQIDGTVYHGPGLGRMTSGHSLQVSMTRNDILRWIFELEKQLNESGEVICKVCKIPIESARFEIKFDDTLKLVETTNNLLLLEFNKQFLPHEELIASSDTS
ncbi:MAG: hypothetical protein ACK5M1_01800 [Xanthomarina gelatinilytica]|uniref:hypothetical protein n=1 Tax=Xanthomarina gelatinilytica TaxID=1137281 RepID=UPI003A844AF2